MCCTSIGDGSVVTSSGHCQVKICVIFLFQAEDGIRDLVRSRGLGDVYKRQVIDEIGAVLQPEREEVFHAPGGERLFVCCVQPDRCLLYTSDAADEGSRVELGGRRFIKKKNKEYMLETTHAS